MNRIFSIFFLCVLMVSYSAGAQDLPADSLGLEESDTLVSFMIPMVHRTKAIGINMTPILKQIIPFNRSNPNVSGPYYVQFRRVKKSGTIARTGLGWNFSTNDFEIPNVNLRFGWEKRRAFYSRWTYNRGFDFVLSTGGFNVNARTEEVEGFLGMQFTWGLDYFILPHVSLNLETGLAIGIGSDDSFTTFFIPPISLNLNYWFVKMK